MAKITTINRADMEYILVGRERRDCRELGEHYCQHSCARLGDCQRDCPCEINLETDCVRMEDYFGWNDAETIGVYEGGEACGGIGIAVNGEHLTLGDRYRILYDDRA